MAFSWQCHIDRMASTFPHLGAQLLHYSHQRLRRGDSQTLSSCSYPMMSMSETQHGSWTTMVATVFLQASRVDGSVADWRNRRCSELCEYTQNWTSLNNHFPRRQWVHVSEHAASRSSRRTNGWIKGLPNRKGMQKQRRQVSISPSRPMLRIGRTSREVKTLCREAIQEGSS